MLRYYQQNLDYVFHPLYSLREDRLFCSLYWSWGPVVMILILKQIEKVYCLILLSIALQSHLYKINSCRKVSNRLQKESGSPAFRVKTLGHETWNLEGIWEQTFYSYIMAEKQWLLSVTSLQKGETNIFIWIQNNFESIWDF